MLQQSVLLRLFLPSSPEFAQKSPAEIPPAVTHQPISLKSHWFHVSLSLQLNLPIFPFKTLPLISFLPLLLLPVLSQSSLLSAYFIWFLDGSILLFFFTLLWHLNPSPFSISQTFSLFFCQLCLKSLSSSSLLALTAHTRSCRVTWAVVPCGFPGVHVLRTRSLWFSHSAHPTDTNTQGSFEEQQSLVSNRSLLILLLIQYMEKNLNFL